MLHEVFERGQCPWADPLHLVADERLEQPPEQTAFQHDLGVTRQQRLIALGSHAPFVPRASHEWDSNTLVGEGMPLVPDEPTLVDCDTPAEIARSLGPDTLRERSLAAGIENGFGPEPDVFKARQTCPNDLGGRFDTHRCEQPDRRHSLTQAR